MAFSKSRDRGCEQGKSLLEMTGKPTSPFGSILKPSPLDKPEEQVVNGCQYSSCPSLGHASSIFPEGNVSAIMQTSFEPPRLGSNINQFCWTGLLGWQTCEPLFDFLAGFDHLSTSQPSELALQPVDLTQTRPIQIVVEHGAGGDGPFFYPSMTPIDRLSPLKFGRDLSDAWLRGLPGKQLLNHLMQVRLVFL